DLSGLLDRAVPLSQPGDRQAIRARAGRRLSPPAGHARAGKFAQGRAAGRRHPADRRTAEGLTMRFARLFAPIAALLLVGAGAPDPLATPTGSDWPSDGRDYTAQRYSPLTQIN